MTDFVTIAEAAEHLDMRPATIQPLVRDGVLTGYLDWEKVESRLLPRRRPRQ